MAFFNKYILAIKSKFCSKGVEPVFCLSDEEIRENLRTDEAELISNIYDTCFEIFYKDDDRTKALDTKGASLFGMTGVSLSLVFSLGGLLIEKVSNLPLPLIGCPIPWLVAFYISSSLTLLCSIIMTMLSIRARSDWRWLQDTDIFNQKMIESGNNVYKRYIITHIWKLYKNNFLVNEKKGYFQKIGVALFIAGLLQLLPIIGIIGLYALKKGGFM